ncbi:MAG: PKD domain-containing protein [Kangiellaceae bacterium]|nr:PKD domain-containing protein [Kangiellaceae bacterium]MCW8998712.1 PKD domain-containing protein [Kangiellaceae bacterium]
MTGSYSSGSGNLPPNASFTHSANKLVVSFSDTSSDDNGIYTRSWSFGDGATSSATNPSHTYSAEGTYTVTLTVTDQEGLSDSESQTITVTNGGNTGCNGLSEWGLYTSYVPGDLVSYNGNKYESTWYSTGARPDIFTQVWNNLGPCQ